MDELEITLFTQPHHGWGRIQHIGCDHFENSYYIYCLSAYRYEYPRHIEMDMQLHPEVKYKEKKLPISVYKKISNWWEKFKSKSINYIDQEDYGNCLGSTIYKLKIEAEKISFSFEWYQCHRGNNLLRELAEIIREEC